MDDAAHVRNLLRAVDCAGHGAGPGSHAIAHLLTIADSAAALTPAFQRVNPDVPWMLLAEMGSVIRRAGPDLDRHALTVTLERDLPELRRLLRDR